jgi:hypothetical protein
LSIDRRNRRFVSVNQKEADMKGILAASLVLLVLSSPASTQAPAGAEARLQALNITLPPDAAPAANFVNSVQTGKLLFLSGNTAGWLLVEPLIPPGKTGGGKRTVIMRRRLPSASSSPRYRMALRPGLL